MDDKIRGRPMITQEQIKEHIIHRFENLLLDSVTITSTTPIQGKFKLNVNANDSLNRDIFFTTAPSPVLLEQTITEIIALSSIVVCGKLKEDEMAIFSSISNFECEGTFSLGIPIEGTVTKISDKAGFIRFRGEAYQDKTQAKASADVMAFFTKITHETSLPKKSELPEINQDSPIAQSLFNKRPEMITAHTLKNTSRDSFVTQYTYPKDHPFIKGHFPKNPLMMGVMQWMSVQDSLIVFAQENQLHAPTTITCDAQLIKTDGTLVTEFKSVQISLQKSESGTWVPHLDATKRVYFRSMVKPGESYYTVLNNIEFL